MGPFGAKRDPFVTARLTSIGKVSPPENSAHARVITEHLKERLKVPGEHIVLNFEDVSPKMIALNGETF